MPHSAMAARHPVGLNVIRVTIEAVLVVGHDDLGLVDAHQSRQAVRPNRHRRPPERFGCVIVRPSLHSRVVIAEQLQVGYAQNIATGLEFVASERHNDRLVVPRVAGLDATGRVPELAVGARDQDGSYAFVAVTGEDPARPDRFVIRMGVDRHEGERALGHGRSVRDGPDFARTPIAAGNKDGSPRRPTETVRLARAAADASPSRDMTRQSRHMLPADRGGAGGGASACYLTRSEGWAGGRPSYNA